MTDALSPLPPTASAATLPWVQATDVFLAAAVKNDHTRRAYRRWLAAADRVMGVGSPRDLVPQDLMDFSAWVTAPETELGPASQDQALSALRSFLRWGRVWGVHEMPRDIFGELLKTPKATVMNPYEVLTESEIPRVLAAAKTSRDVALLMVMLGGGLRVGEAVGLDVTDVRSDQEGGGLLYVRQGKGRRDRWVPVHEEVLDAVRDYLVATDRRPGVPGPLFRAHDRGAETRSRRRVRPRRLTEGAVWYVVRECVRAAGITGKTISPHSLRHTYAIRTLRHRGNVVAVQKLLGHSNGATTARYLDHLELPELRQTVPPLPHSPR